MEWNVLKPGVGDIYLKGAQMQIDICLYFQHPTYLIYLRKVPVHMPHAPSALVPGKFRRFTTACVGGIKPGLNHTCVASQLITLRYSCLIEEELRSTRYSTASLCNNFQVPKMQPWHGFTNHKYSTVATHANSLFCNSNNATTKIIYK